MNMLNNVFIIRNKILKNTTDQPTLINVSGNVALFILGLMGEWECDQQESEWLSEVCQFNSGSKSLGEWKCAHVIVLKMVRVR